MVDVPVGAAFGALRLGIQIVSTERRPVIEIYQRTHNVLGPEWEYGYPGAPGGVQKTRSPENYLSFTAVNIGTQRAENVSFRPGDGLKRERPFSFGELFQTTIPYLAPGQAIMLLRLEESEIFEYSWKMDEKGFGTGTRVGLKKERLQINIAYDGPRNIFNTAPLAFSRIFSKRQYNFKYEFEPRSVATDYPPVEVVG